MPDTSHAKRTVIGADARPILPRHVKLRRDEERGRWVILAPERVFTPDPIAVAVLELCDGTRTVEAIARELAKTYNAPVDQILRDVMEMLQGLADKGVVKA